EAAFTDQLLQLAVGGAEDAHIDANLAFAADAAEAALAEKVHQLGLQVRRHLGDLVEKHRAAVGQFQQAGLAAALGAAGDARRVAEQFAIGLVFRHGRATERQEGRSEERRVGKEGRAGWSPEHKKKKNNT